MIDTDTKELLATYDTLTEKQKANRAYYAANAEKVREQKRQYYQEPRKPKKKPSTYKPKLKKSVIKKPLPKPMSPEAITRRKIEDWQMDRDIRDIESYNSYL